MIQRTGKSNTAVVGWGRGMGHKGHMLLARAVIIQAQNMGADPYFFVSRTVGADDPLYPDEKLYIYKKVFPKQANIFQSATDEIPDINRLMRTLAELGYKNAVLVVGADQVKAFQYLVGQDKAGNVVYKTLGLENLSVIKRQDVDDAAQAEEGPRATPMREILKDPNASDEQKFAVWRDAMPNALSDKEVLALMQKASQRMGEFKPATKKAKVKEFIQRVRPMLKEANAQQKLKLLRLMKESLKRMAEDDEPAMTSSGVPWQGPKLNREVITPPEGLEWRFGKNAKEDPKDRADARHFGTVIASVPNPITKAAGMMMRYAGQDPKDSTNVRIAKAMDSAGTPDEISRYLKKKAVKEDDIPNEKTLKQQEQDRWSHYDAAKKAAQGEILGREVDGKVISIPPGHPEYDETFDDLYRQQNPGYPTPNDPGFYLTPFRYPGEPEPAYTKALVEIDEPFNLEKRHSMDYGMRKTMIRRLAKATDYDVSDLSLASDEELADLYKQVFPDNSINEDYLDEK